MNNGYAKKISTGKNKNQSEIFTLTGRQKINGQSGKKRNKEENEEFECHDLITLQSKQIAYMQQCCLTGFNATLWPEHINT